MYKKRSNNFIKTQIELTMILLFIIVFACSLPNTIIPKGQVQIVHDEVEIEYKYNE